MSDGASGGHNAGTSSGKQRSRILDVLDTIAKLAAAAAIVFGAHIASTYESKMTAISIMSEREQAESHLRATMFSNLISPITGPVEKSKDIPAERLKLLTELLALNFHEHFEFKPLLEYVDKSLLTEESKSSLRSIARRVTDRQVASLLNGGSGNDRTKIKQLIFIEKINPEILGPEKAYFESLMVNDAANFGSYIACRSPDGKWTLDITVKNLVMKNGHALPEIFIIIRNSEKHLSDIIKTFTLTYFDFPVTDNTLLSDGNRFSVVIEKIEDNQAKLKLIWFPKNYFTARERPVNYNKMLENLGVSKDTPNEHL